MNIILPKKLTIFFDGGCTKNPGGIATYAYIIKCSETNNTLKTDSGEALRGPNASNNVGEWFSVLSALRYLKENNWNGELKILGDSQLVINQLNGEYRCKKENLIPYYKESLQILENMNWKANWIPREENSECDAISR